MILNPEINPDHKQKQHWLEKFRQLPPRAVIRIPVKFLTPTQPDTGELPPNTHAPISCYYDPDGRIVIVDGHKRYYAMLKKGRGKKIAVRRVPDPSY